MRFRFFPLSIEWPLSSNSLRHTPRHLELYHSLTILNNLYNRVFSGVWIPTLKWSCTVFALLDLYGMVRLVEALPILVYLYLPVIYTFFIILFVRSSELMADVYDVSRLQSKNWTRHTLKLGYRQPIIVRWRNSKLGTKYFQLFLRACRPLRCEVGPYFIEGRTKVILLSNIVNGGISILLTFQ
jgi:hypothetical protein